MRGKSIIFGSFLLGVVTANAKICNLIKMGESPWSDERGVIFIQEFGQKDKGNIGGKGCTYDEE